MTDPQTRATEARGMAMLHLTDAISGERRHWHRVEVAPDDIAVVIAAVGPLPMTEPQTPATVTESISWRFAALIFLPGVIVGILIGMILR